MEPSTNSSERHDSRQSITIHKVSVETKLRFNTLCSALNKHQYELFDEMIDLYMRNLDGNVSSRQQKVIVRKLLDDMYRLAELKKP